MNDLDFALLNDFQRAFPLCQRPFARIGAQLGAHEHDVLNRVKALIAGGQISRVGAVFAPQAIGASTLAALRVAPERLEEVAARIGRHPQINHNYEREHDLNLWFVATAGDDVELAAVLARIEAEAGCGAVLVLPLVQEFRIDLGFDLRRGARPLASTRTPIRQALSTHERALVAALQDGLPALERPFAAVAARASWDEETVLTRIAEWVAAGVIRRFGVVVRHHELGFAANAMVVWDVPDDRVSDCGRLLAQQADVSLCYLRRRSPARWPYNLFCMVHGRDRARVEARVEALTGAAALSDYPRALLFSRTRFKQRGARYCSDLPGVPAAA